MQSNVRWNLLFDQVASADGFVQKEGSLQQLFERGPRIVAGLFPTSNKHRTRFFEIISERASELGCLSFARLERAHTHGHAPLRCFDSSGGPTRGITKADVIALMWDAFAHLVDDYLGWKGLVDDDVGSTRDGGDTEGRLAPPRWRNCEAQISECR